MRNKQYKVYSVRLEEENINWLKKESEKFKSPNIFFRELKKTYKLTKKA